MGLAEGSDAHKSIISQQKSLLALVFSGNPCLGVRTTSTPHPITKKPYKPGTSRYHRAMYAPRFAASFLALFLLLSGIPFTTQADIDSGTMSADTICINPNADYSCDYGQPSKKPGKVCWYDRPCKADEIGGSVPASGGCIAQNVCRATQCAGGPCKTADVPVQPVTLQGTPVEPPQTTPGTPGPGKSVLDAMLNYPQSPPAQFSAESPSSNSGFDFNRYLEQTVLFSGSKQPQFDVPPLFQGSASNLVPSPGEPNTPDIGPSPMEGFNPPSNTGFDTPPPTESPKPWIEQLAQNVRDKSNAEPLQQLTAADQRLRNAWEAVDGSADTIYAKQQTLESARTELDRVAGLVGGKFDPETGKFEFSRPVSQQEADGFNDALRGYNKALNTYKNDTDVARYQSVAREYQGALEAARPALADYQRAVSEYKGAIEAQQLTQRQYIDSLEAPQDMTAASLRAQADGTLARANAFRQQIQDTTANANWGTGFSRDCWGICRTVTENGVTMPLSMYRNQAESLVYAEEAGAARLTRLADFFSSSDPLAEKIAQTSLEGTRAQLVLNNLDEMLIARSHVGQYYAPSNAEQLAGEKLTAVERLISGGELTPAERIAMYPSTLPTESIDRQLQRDRLANSNLAKVLPLVSIYDAISLTNNPTPQQWQQMAAMTDSQISDLKFGAWQRAAADTALTGAMLFGLTPPGAQLFGRAIMAVTPEIISSTIANGLGATWRGFEYVAPATAGVFREWAVAGGIEGEIGGFSVFRANADFKPTFAAELDTFGTRVVNSYIEQEQTYFAQNVARGISPEVAEATAYRNLYENIARTDIAGTVRGGEMLTALEQEMAAKNISLPAVQRAILDIAAAEPIAPISPGRSPVVYETPPIRNISESPSIIPPNVPEVPIEAPALVAGNALAPSGQSGLLETSLSQRLTAAEAPAEQVANFTRPLVPATEPPTVAQTNAIQNYSNAAKVYAGLQTKVDAGLLSRDTPLFRLALDDYLNSARALGEVGLMERPSLSLDNIVRANTGEVLASRPFSISTEPNPFQIVEGAALPAPVSEVPPAPSVPTPSLSPDLRPLESAPSFFEPPANPAPTILAERPAPPFDFFANLRDPFELPIAPAINLPSAPAPIIVSPPPVITQIFVPPASASSFFNTLRPSLASLLSPRISSPNLPPLPLSEAESDALNRLNSVLANQSSPIPSDVSPSSADRIRTLRTDMVAAALNDLAGAGLQQNPLNGNIERPSGDVVAKLLPIALSGEAPYGLTLPEQPPLTSKLASEIGETQLPIPLTETAHPVSIADIWAAIMSGSIGNLRQVLAGKPLSSNELTPFPASEQQPGEIAPEDQNQIPVETPDIFPPAPSRLANLPQVVTLALSLAGGFGTSAAAEPFKLAALPSVASPSFPAIVPPPSVKPSNSFTARTTFYGPGAGGSVQGGWETAFPNLEGKAIPRTLDEVRLGKSRYVSVATAPENKGKFFYLGDVTYRSPIDNKVHTMKDVYGYSHDTGDAFKVGTCAKYNTCSVRLSKVDIAVGDFRGWSGSRAYAFLTGPGQSYGGSVVHPWQQVAGLPSAPKPATVAQTPPAPPPAVPKPVVADVVAAPPAPAPAPVARAEPVPAPQFGQPLQEQIQKLQGEIASAESAIKNIRNQIQGNQGIIQKIHALDVVVRETNTRLATLQEVKHNLETNPSVAEVERGLSTTREFESEAKKLMVSNSPLTPAARTRLQSALARVVAARASGETLLAYYNKLTSLQALSQKDSLETQTRQIANRLLTSAQGLVSESGISVRNQLSSLQGNQKQLAAQVVELQATKNQLAAGLDATQQQLAAQPPAVVAIVEPQVPVIPILPAKTEVTVAKTETIPAPAPAPVVAVTEPAPASAPPQTVAQASFAMPWTPSIVQYTFAHSMFAPPAPSPTSQARMSFAIRPREPEIASGAGGTQPENLPPLKSLPPAPSLAEVAATREKYLQDPVTATDAFKNFPRLKLAGAEAKLQEASIAKYLSNKQGLLDDYRTYFGDKDVNPDFARLLFRDIGYSGTNSGAVQKVVADITDNLWRENLANPGEYVAIYTGSSGAGKSSVAKAFLSGVTSDTAAILDGTLSNQSVAKQRIAEALEAGKKVQVVNVYRDPIDAWHNGVIARMNGDSIDPIDTGRVVPISVFAVSYKRSLDIVKSLLANPQEGVEVTLIDNSKGSGNQTEMSREEFLAIKYSNNIERMIRNDTRKLLEAGVITPEQYAAITNSEAPVKLTVASTEPVVPLDADVSALPSNISPESGSLTTSNEILDQALPTLEERADLYLRAVYGPDHVPTVAEKADAQQRIVGAIAKDAMQSAWSPYSVFRVIENENPLPSSVNTGEVSGPQPSLVETPKTTTLAKLLTQLEGWLGGAEKIPPALKIVENPNPTPATQESTRVAEAQRAQFQVVENTNSVPEPSPAATAPALPPVTDTVPVIPTTAPAATTPTPAPTTPTVSSPDTTPTASTPEIPKGVTLAGLLLRGTVLPGDISPIPPFGIVRNLALNTVSYLIAGPAMPFLNVGYRFIVNSTYRADVLESVARMRGASPSTVTNVVPEAVSTPTVTTPTPTTPSVEPAAPTPAPGPTTVSGATVPPTTTGGGGSGGGTPPTPPGGTPPTPPSAGGPNDPGGGRVWSSMKNHPFRWILGGTLGIGIPGLLVYLESNRLDTNAPAGQQPPPNKPDGPATTPPPSGPTGPAATPPPQPQPQPQPPPRVTVGPSTVGRPDSGGLGGTILSQNDYCITSIEPMIVIPLSAGTRFPSNCYNSPAGGSSSIGSILGQLLAKLLGIGQPQQTPSPTAPKSSDQRATSSPPVVTLIANPSTVASGTKAILAWSSIGTSQCSIRTSLDVEVGQGTNGATSTPVLATTTAFTVRCTTSLGANIMNMATVTVATTTP